MPRHTFEFADSRRYERRFTRMHDEREFTMADKHDEERASVTRAIRREP